MILLTLNDWKWLYFGLFFLDKLREKKGLFEVLTPLGYKFYLSVKNSFN